MSAPTVASIFRDLRNEDFRVLTAIELGMVSREFVPFERVVKISGLSKGIAEKKLAQMSKARLLRRVPPEMIGYDGYTLNYAGYDALALNALVKRDTLDALGLPLGLGKESDVYEAFLGKRLLVAKFHRAGRVSFRQIKRARDYASWGTHSSWLYQSRLAAEREFEGLTRAHQNSVSVPKPIAQNRHLLVMGEIDGLRLTDYQERYNPDSVLKEILLNVKRAFEKARVVHGDLSEYNVVLKPSGHVMLIDWPQFVPRQHPRALEFLQRDVKNVVGYFSRKFRLQVNFRQCLDYVLGKAKTWRVSR